MNICDHQRRNQPHMHVWLGTSHLYLLHLLLLYMFSSWF